MESKLNLSAVVWDMDGTLIDSAVAVPEAFIATVIELGGQVYDVHEVVALYSLGEPSVMLTHLLGRAATDRDVALYHAHLSARAHTVRAYPGIHDVLRKLMGQVKLGVFTGASTQAAYILLETVGMASYFGAIVGGDTVGRPKPDPAGIHRACQDLGVLSANAAYVGDAPTDIEAAVRSGAVPIAATWGHLFRGAEPHILQARTPSDVLGLL